MGATETIQFIPIGLSKGPSAPVTPEPALQPAAVACISGSIEIALPNGVRVSVDPFVSEKALSRVLLAMRGVT
jgi:hypothetical protein